MRSVIHEEANSWHLFERILFNTKTFPLGIGLIKTESDKNNKIDKVKEVSDENDILSEMDDLHFQIKEREMHVHFPHAKATGSLGNNKTKHAAPRYNRALGLLKKIDPAAYSAPPGVVLYNSHRREETFLPLLNEEEELGLYIFPWLSKSSSTFEFSGFAQFVTAGCMFGAGLRGVDGNGGNLPLIKHDIRFYQEQKVESIEFIQGSSHPYTKMLFSELKMLTWIINKYAMQGKGKSLTYHLPVQDYMLFGVELFVRGRITKKALNEFFCTIAIYSNTYREKVKNIFEEHEINVDIQSPFENLFSITDEENMLDPIFQKIGLSTEEVDPCSVTPEEQKRNEKALVQACLLKLCTNNINALHRQVWQDFLKIFDSESINNLEDLFKLANAVMLAIASKGKENYKTCSLLPLAEKQIQVSYDDYSKQYLKMQKSPPAKKISSSEELTFSKESNLLPSICMFTFLEPLYQATTPRTPNCSMFYYEKNHRSLVQPIKKKDILECAYKNIFLLSKLGASLGLSKDTAKIVSQEIDAEYPKQQQDKEKLTQSSIGKFFRIEDLLSPRTLSPRNTPMKR